MSHERKIDLEGLSIILCNKSFLRRINKKYLKHDFDTDIISFEYDFINGRVGELYVGIDTVKTNAEKFRVAVTVEAYRVIFHGLLHLCGYLDKTIIQQEKMRAKEDYYLNPFLKSLKHVHVNP